MLRWPRYPNIFEINAWVWLTALGKQYRTSLGLGDVPPQEWDAIADLGIDAVWLMGVWERSPAGIAIANRNPALLADFKRALPDFIPVDNTGSPYCIRRYVVDPRLGGPGGLETVRRELARRGVRLLLDFVPNHVAPDHPWVTAHPEYFIAGSAEDVRKDPASFVAIGGSVFACGRDPYFPAWPDVLQLNPFRPCLREAVRDTISGIASQCDGIRCDMAMLFLNAIFERTWGSRAGQKPATEYWADLILAIKKSHPQFLFLAEAYWDLEWQLQQQGFDFCYDKRLYDRLEQNDPESVRLHLCANLTYQDRLLRFIENHDEPRAAALFSPAKEQALAVAIATLPGARLFHDGQFEGRKIRLPVFMCRRPDEPIDEELRAFYLKLLKAASGAVFREGQWRLCQCTGWPDNASFQNLVAWSWTWDEDRYLIAINLSGYAVQARVLVTWQDVSNSAWQLTDAMSGAVYDRAGDEIGSVGLYVEMRAWSFHFLQCRRH
jgi:hypothetical protein